jgi:hypothetical protein
MRAQVLRAFGGSENFELRNIAVPEIRPHLVAHACPLRRRPDITSRRMSRDARPSHGMGVESEVSPWTS